MDPTASLGEPFINATRFHEDFRVSRSALFLGRAASVVPAAAH
jgi:hypothetical protein